MIARDIQDTLSGLRNNLSTVALTLGKRVKVFNASEDFAEFGIELENLSKGANMILVQATRVGDEVKLTFSPWYKSWKGSRIVVPNLAHDEAVRFIEKDFLPAFDRFYPSKAQEFFPIQESENNPWLHAMASRWKQKLLAVPSEWWRYLGLFLAGLFLGGFLFWVFS